MMGEAIRVLEGQIVDRDAAEIGDLYRQAKSAIVGSVYCLLKAGVRLIEKKSTLDRGRWIPWIKENREILGFEDGVRTAQRLMKACTKYDVDVVYDEDAAIKISRTIWGNADSSLIQQSLSNEHYTPAQYIEAARAVLGGIDLDPASCDAANRVVLAKTFFDQSQNGLTKGWHGRIWLNPPYGDEVGQFIDKLMHELEAKRTSSAIVLVNAHCTDTKWFQPLWNGVLCFTNHRINFAGDETRSGSTHGSVFVYFGENHGKFKEIFSKFGAVVRRVHDNTEPPFLHRSTVGLGIS